MPSPTRCHLCTFEAKNPQGLAGHIQLKHRAGRAHSQIEDPFETRRRRSPTPPPPREAGPSREELERMVEQLGQRLVQGQRSAQEQLASRLAEQLKPLLEFRDQQAKEVQDLHRLVQEREVFPEVPAPEPRVPAGPLLSAARKYWPVVEEVQNRPQLFPLRGRPRILGRRLL